VRQVNRASEIVPVKAIEWDRPSETPMTPLVRSSTRTGTRLFWRELQPSCPSSPPPHIQSVPSSANSVVVCELEPSQLARQPEHAPMMAALCVKPIARNLDS